MQEFQKVHLMQFSALFDMADFNLTSLAFFCTTNFGPEQGLKARKKVQEKSPSCFKSCHDVEQEYLGFSLSISKNFYFVEASPIQY